MSASAPGCDHALRAVEPEHPRRRGRGQLDPALQGDLAGDDALVEQVHPVLDRADAVGDRAEVALAELLLVLHAERAVVGRDHLQVVGAQALPHRVLVALLARSAAASSRPTSPPRSRPTRRSGAELLLEREVEVLRAGLAEDVLAAGRGPRRAGRRPAWRSRGRRTAARSVRSASMIARWVASSSICQARAMPW